MRNRFDEQLELLNVELIRMGALCEDAISYASRTLMGEGDFAEEVYKVDHEIDQKERDIENLCMRLLLQQQPVAKDLRRISARSGQIPDFSAASRALRSAQSLSPLRSCPSRSECGIRR